LVFVDWQLSLHFNSVLIRLDLGVSAVTL
jgi:hypothetical protein